MASVKADDRKAQRANLGVHLCTTPSDLYLFEKSNEMLALLTVWAENWETIRATVEPKVADIRTKLIEAKAKELAKVTGVNWETLVALANTGNAPEANAPEANAEGVA